jgi:hypothetical protein
MIQGMRDKVSIAGFVRDGNRNTFLSADAPTVEMNTAKEILRKLYESAPGTGWHVDIQSEVVTIHCNLHDTYAYRCPPPVTRQRVVPCKAYRPRDGREDTGRRMIDEYGSALEGEEHISTEEIAGDTDWLAIAKEAFQTSTDYLDANYRAQWEKNLANFANTHPPGSKYHTDAYKLRSRLFRPKTRSAAIKAEAAFAEAMFSTAEVLNVDPVDQGDAQDDAMAEVWQAVLNWRIKKDIPWYLTAIGAFQESRNYGIVISRQYWEYEAIDRRLMRKSR